MGPMKRLYERLRRWARARAYELAMWLLARAHHDPSGNAIDRFIHGARTRDPRDANTREELATLYRQGFVDGLNSRGVPADLLIQGEGALKNASWEELDTIARAAETGFYMTRQIPQRPISGYRRSNR